MISLQRGGYVLSRITRILKKDNFSRLLSNCQIVQISFRKVGLKAIAVKNFFTLAKNTHAVGFGTSTKLAWLRAGVGMITMSSVSIFRSCNKTLPDRIS